MKWKLLLAFIAAFAGGSFAGWIVNSMSFIRAEGSLGSEWGSSESDERSRVHETPLTFIGSEGLTEIDTSRVRVGLTEYDGFAEYDGFGDFRATLIEMRALSSLANEDAKAALLGLAELHDLPPSGIRLVEAAVLTVVAERSPEVALQWMTENSSRLIQPNRRIHETHELERGVWKNLALAMLSERSDSDDQWIQEIIDSGSQVGSGVALEMVSQRDFRRAVELVNQNLDKTWVIEDIENGFVNGLISGYSMPSIDEAVELHEWLSETFTGSQKTTAEFKILRKIIESGQIEGARVIVSRFKFESKRRIWEDVISRASQ